MLNFLDHIVLVCPNMDAGVASYAAVFGHGPAWRAVNVESGAATAVFQFENTALELLAPVGEGSAAERLREILDGRGKSGILTSLAFSTENIKSAHHVLLRRGLSPSAVTKGQSQHIETGLTRTWSRFRLDDNACADLKTFVLEPISGDLPASNMSSDHVSRLDHLVINTPNPTRAIAHYAGRLGLRFALDRTIEKFGTRFLFFRIGDLTLEVIYRLNEEEDPNGPDKLWGLTWEVETLSSAHERLKQAGVNVSDIRKGRKPGTEVFTLRGSTLGVPTLFLAKV